MNDVERWLRRQAAREQHGVLLEEALLGDRLWRYTWHRLRYFFLKYVVESAVHAATVLLLLVELSWSGFLPIVVAATATSVVSGFWWGALEGLRAQVRDLHRSGRPQRIARVIGGWLTLSALLGAAVAAGAVAWLGWSAATGSLGAGQAYVGVLLLRLAADLPTRCYHSGVYALRRVYKPLVAVLAPPVLELAVLLVLWPLVGLWALVAASAVLTVVLTALTLRYTGRVYRFIGYDPRHQVGLARLRAALSQADATWLPAGAANTVIALDALVVLAVLQRPGTGAAAVVVLFVAAPSIRAGADWARLFYFDLKRLELGLFTNLRRRFEHHTGRLAWLLGGVFWAAASAIAAAVAGARGTAAFGALLLFFLARAHLARGQVQAFAAGAYKPVLLTGGLLVGGAATAGRLVGGTALLTAVGALTAVAAAALEVLRRRAEARGAMAASLLTLDWLRRLGQQDAPVRIGSARLAAADGPDRLDARTAAERTRWRLAQLADQTARRLGSRGAATWLGSDRLVWFERADGPAVVTARELQLASGGLVAAVVVRELPGGEEALLAAATDQLLGPASAALRTAVVPVDVAAARRRFAETVPGGIVYAPDEPVPAALAARSGSELRAVLVDAVAFARDLRVTRRRSRSDVTALCAGGELRLVFIADLHVDKRLRARWRAHLVRLNVRAAIGGARTAAAAAPGRGRLPRRRPSLHGRVVRRLPAAVHGRRGPAAARAEALRHVPLLAGLGDRELRQVAGAMSSRRFAAGEQVTREGEAGVGFYVIAAGEAQVTVGGRVVGRLGPGDHFGELALIAETPRLATVTACTDLECHRMASWEFRRLVEGSATISWQVLQATAALLHEARQRSDAPSTVSS